MTGMYVTMPEEMLERLRQQADAEERSISQVVRRAVRASWAQPAAIEVQCTGLTASWCPVHGACTCPPDSELPDGERGDLDDPHCPLHAATSTHAATVDDGG